MGFRLCDLRLLSILSQTFFNHLVPEWQVVSALLTDLFSGQVAYYLKGSILEPQNSQPNLFKFDYTKLTNYQLIYRYMKNATFEPP
jgi:hypothetical protein